MRMKRGKGDRVGGGKGRRKKRESFVQMKSGIYIGFEM